MNTAQIHPTRDGRIASASANAAATPRTRLAHLLGVLLIVGTGLGAGQAGAAPRGADGGMDGPCDGPMMGFMGGPGGHMMGGMGGPDGPAMGGMGAKGESRMASPERMQARLGKMVKHLAVEANATPEQTAKLEAIAQAAAADLMPLRGQMHDNRQATRTALLAPTIDRGQLETLRGEHLRLAETMSRRMTQAIADAAEILSPEQRQALADHMAKRRQHHGRHGGRH